MLKAKLCRLCKVELTIENAYVSRKRKQFQSNCKACGKTVAKEWHAKNHDRELERRKKYYVKNRDKIRDQTERARVLRKYKMSPEQIEEMRLSQSGVCLICQKRQATDVDHCHKSGNVRGMLCGPCNSVLGFVNDCTDSLKRAISYLENNK